MAGELTCGVVRERYFQLGGLHMKLQWVLVVVVVIVSIGRSGASESGVEIAIPDSYLGADKITAGDDWWGIFPDNAGFTLKATSVSVRTIEFEDKNSETGKSTGIEISVPDENKPVAVLRGLKSVKVGALTGAVRGVQKNGYDGSSFLFPGQIYDVTIRNWRLENQMQIFATGTAEKPGGYAVRFSKYELLLSRGSCLDETRQVLLSADEFTSWACPGPCWIGDLDNDGKPDFLLNQSTSESGTDLMLYLSSAAKAGELVGLVVEWHAYKGC